MTGKLALHQKIARTLRRQILSGAFDADGRLPDETSLAKQFGVSRTTISRVMLDLKAGGLITTCAGTPARLSRFAKNATGVIGIVDPGRSCGPILSAICSRMAQLVEKSGWRVERRTLTETDPDARADEALRIAGDFAKHRVSGVILQPLEFQCDNVSANRALVECLDANGMSVVLLDYDITQKPERSKYDLVSIDNVAAGQMVAERLLANGARRIGFVLPPNAPSSLMDRMHGVALAALGANRSWRHASNILVSEPDDRGRVVRFLKAFRPEAVVLGNDSAALRFKSVLDSVGRGARPALGAFDGLPEAVAAGIVSVRQPVDKLAYVAVQTLLSRIKFPNLPRRTVTLDAELA